MNAATVDIVIVNWNSGALLRQCLASLAGLCVGGQGLVEKVMVVDNASHDASLAGLPELPFPLVVQENARNAGFAAACNQGARLGTARYILFLNPDTRVFPDSLALPVSFMERHMDVGICGIQLVDDQGRVARSCSRFPRAGRVAAKMLGVSHVFPRSGERMLEWDHGDSREVDQVMGAFFLVRREVFEALAGFDPRFFVYYEEVDFSLRARMAGWRSYFLASAHAFHAGCGTTRHIRAERLFHLHSSRILYGFKHFGLPSAIVLLFLTLLVEPLPRLCLALVRGEWTDLGATARSNFMLWRAMPELFQKIRGVASSCASLR